jgi:hypothetical protein
MREGDMKYLVPVALLVVMVIAIMAASSVIRKNTGLGPYLSLKGFIIFAVGYVVCAVVYMHFWAGSLIRNSLLMGVIAGLWLLIGQYVGGARQGRSNTS